MSFDLLSEPIRRYIRDKRWEELRPIQIAAISKILSTRDNYILASRTASGKTEAAFLPILSKVNFEDPGVQVLYISPLIALINDQFGRIEELCKYLDVTVTKWHGEANKSGKDRLIKQPNGIILITPESIEAMFVNKPHNVKHLFSNLKFVVIDEIHSFIGADRGVQLKSILSRLQDINTDLFTVVGLSATIGDYNEAKKFTGDELKTKVLLDRTAKEINAQFKFFIGEKDELPLELMKDLYLETKDSKALIFPNSRGRAEEVAVKLKKISERVKGHANYFSHHSSVDQEVREYVEYFAKNSVRQNFCISCTSTLELGIDIGSVDQVIQIDATHSIASLIQRVGRSGRKEGEKSNLFLYATDKWSLLQSLACWLLYKEGYIEPPLITDKPYDILLHQILSIVKGHSGIRIEQLVKELKRNFAFSKIETTECQAIVKHLIEIDFLEKLQNEVIIGVEGEWIVNSRDFYSVFKAEENFKVLNAGNKIGEIPISPQIREDENILLAAKIWKIKYVDYETKKIEVIKALDGKKPSFFGGGATIHPRIRTKMFEIIYSNETFEVLDKLGSEEMESMRKEFRIFDITDLSRDRPLLVTKTYLQLFTFTGTRINHTLGFLFDLAGIKSTLNDSHSSIDIEGPEVEFRASLKKLPETLKNIDQHIQELLISNPGVLGFSKWGAYLPVEHQVNLMKQKYFDLDGAREFVESRSLKNNC
ncbi:DEAD/DEAH box helicase [Pedobacter sp. P351]|uniref:DEAD/DEAH box helicase n=1 Tax=Pedobacter superstes TaxID=3133441 RepID=UPI00309E62B7